jgi:hypothetical protein
MEPDRYQENHGLYIIGLICFLISTTLSLFVLYMLPHLLFGWRYDVPEFITYFREWIIANLEIGPLYASWCIFFFLLLLAALFAWVAHYATQQLDHVVPDLNLADKTNKSLRFSKKPKQTTHILLKIIAFAYWLILRFEGLS